MGHSRMAVRFINHRVLGVRLTASDELYIIKSLKRHFGDSIQMYSIRTIHYNAEMMNTMSNSF